MRVPVVNGDSAAAESFTQGLRRHGFDAESVESGTAALETYPRADLVLLDLELPDLDGLEVCRARRADGDTPIIAVTDGDNELGRVLGLQAGSDDCLEKDTCLGRPHGFRELMARIEAVMRRSRPHRLAARAISHAELHIHPGRREVRVHGRSVALTRKEFDLLHLLASHPDRIVTRKRIMSEVSEDPHQATASRTLDMHVSSVRARLGDGSWIITARGVGFRLGHGVSP